MPVNRKNVRAAVTSALTPYLTAATTVEDHYVWLQGESPVVMVLSAGSNRLPLTGQGNYSAFRIEIGIYVRRVGGNWTEGDALNTLDDLEQQVAAFVEAKKGRTDDWDRLLLDGESLVDPFLVKGGILYWREVIPLTVIKYG